MYDELVKALRETDFSYGCPCEAEPLCKEKDCVIIQAADAIEELMRKCEQLPSADAVPVVRCKDCKWWTKQEASLQGKCDAYGMYPTGEWYCARGERR